MLTDRVSPLKTSYPAGTLAFPANAGYLLRHANDILPPKLLAPLTRWHNIRVISAQIEFLGGTTGKIVAFPQVGGLHHRYERLAA